MLPVQGAALRIRHQAGVAALRARVVRRGAAAHDAADHKCILQYIDEFAHIDLASVRAIRLLMPKALVTGLLQTRDYHSR